MPGIRPQSRLSALRSTPESNDARGLGHRMLGWVNPDRDQLREIAKILVPGIVLLAVVVLLLTRL